MRSVPFVVIRGIRAWQVMPLRVDPSCCRYDVCMDRPQIQYTHTADGVAIAYAVIGEGPPLLFLRPFLGPGLDDEIARSRQIWSALSESHSVVLWDLRGTGLSGSAPEAGFDDWLADMDSVAGAAGAGRFDIVGNNIPCNLAMTYAARHPDRVNRLTLYCPSPPGTSLRQTQPAWLFAILSEDWHAFVDFLALRLFGWDRAPAARRWADQTRARYTASQFLQLMDVIESIDATRDAGSIKAPTLVIDDRGYAGRTPAHQQFVRQVGAAIPGAQLAIISPGEGSAAQVIEQFLSGGGGAAATLSEGPAPSGTAVILFTDIVDSTALTERLGDARFREASRALDERLRAAIREGGGTPIEGKVLGDGVMASFSSAREAIAVALRCAELSAESELGLHIGLHAGDVIHEADNVFGGTVNIASRICGLSAPGEVLVSDVVRGMARSSAGVTFIDRGDHDMKGIGEPVRLYAVVASPRG